MSSSAFDRARLSFGSYKMPIDSSTSSGRQPSAGTITGFPNESAAIADPDVRTCENGSTADVRSIQIDLKILIGEKGVREHVYAFVLFRQGDDLVGVTSVESSSGHDGQPRIGGRTFTIRPDQLFDPLIYPGITEKTDRQTRPPAAAACALPRPSRFRWGRCRYSGRAG